MIQTVWVVQRISDGKFLKKPKAIQGQIHYKAILDTNHLDHKRAVKKLEDAFTNKLGSARIYRTEKEALAVGVPGPWQSWEGYEKGYVTHADWLKDGYVRVIPIECHIPEYIE